jgi:type VI secretion system protein ImpL
MKELPVLRPLLIALGWLAAAVLVWFVGPLLAIGKLTPLDSLPERTAAVAALLALAVAHATWRALASARRNRRLLDGIAAPVPGAQDMAAIGKSFDDALAKLRRARIGGRHPWLAALAGRPYVYELPWYVIIGAPGAGKTTALVNSGLQFPLADELGQKVLRGVGGTRHCDWWFASDAVLIDTAGRYTTHDSDRASDRAAWLGFLGLLKRYRPRRPINGVLLTISVSDLLTADAQARRTHAAELRGRIDELYRELGLRVPVYVLITKTDLLAGFMEFFSDFDKEERAQVWGVTFPYGGDTARNDALLRMASDFATLEKRLNECLIDRLQAESDRERRAALYAFPQQWRLLRETLYEFLQQALADTPGAAPALVRGVYFTSATQEGTPMDRALGGLARALGLSGRLLPAARPSGKTFFVTRLLRDVVFAESGLAGTDLRWQRRRALLQWGAVGVFGCATVAAALLGWRAYEDARAGIAEMAARVPGLENAVAAAGSSAATDLPALLPTLQSLQGLGEGAAARRFHLGLDRHEMLAAAAQDAYQRLLKDGLLPRIAARLEERLRNGGRAHVELIYETLKSYLMLFAGRNFDASALRAALISDWDATLPPSTSAADRTALRRHLDALLKGGEVGAPSQADAQLIADARRTVGSVPLAQRAYSRLKQIELGSEAAEFSVESAGGSAARRVFARASGQPLSQGVPALYSRAVYQQSLPQRTQTVLRQFSGEQSWVLGRGEPAAAAPAALADEVLSLYRADYALLWKAFIADLRLVPTTTLPATAELSALLARPDSPLTALLRGMVREVSVDVPGAERFDALRRFVEGQPSPADDAQALLGKLSSHLTAVEDAAQRKTAPPASEVPRELAAFAQRAPEPLHAMLGQLASTASSQVFTVLREPLARELASDIAPACARAIAGRYPLQRNSSEDLSRAEFVKLFGAGGLLDGFYQRRLQPYADATARSEAMPAFAQARVIRDAYFRDGGRQLGMKLEFRLLEMDPGLGEFALDVDGQHLSFKRDARAPQALLWPGAGDSSRVHLQVTPGGGYDFQGTWALFRLLDRVRIEPGASPDRVLLSFDVEGRKARFEVRSASAPHPLMRQVLEQFQCPKRL